MPADYAEELDGKAFKDHLGEFTISALPVEALTTKDDFIIETLQLVCTHKAVKRVMVIAGDSIPGKMGECLRQADADEKRVTVFSMNPSLSVPCRHEVLGYSLMAALGIKGEEIGETINNNQ